MFGASVGLRTYNYSGIENAWDLGFRISISFLLSWEPLSYKGCTKAPRPVLLVYSGLDLIIPKHISSGTHYQSDSGSTKSPNTTLVKECYRFWGSV